MLNIEWTSFLAFLMHQAQKWEYAIYWGVIALFLHLTLKKIEAYLVDPQRMKKPLEPATVKAFGHIARFSIILLVGLSLLQAWGYSISGLLTFGGIGGIALGFAAKDLLANLFGGLMIHWDQPFAVGDHIASPDRKIEGIIEDIGWRVTRIRNLEKRPIYIPNGLFSTVVIENISRMSHRRIDERLHLRYQDVPKIASIVADCQTMLKEHKQIDQKETLIVQLDQWSDKGPCIRMTCHVKETSTQFFSIKQDLLLKVGLIIHQHQAEFALVSSNAQ